MKTTREDGAIVLKHEKIILIIAYAFAPISSEIGIRPLKIAKYLKTCGWTPIVLTIERGLKHVFDQSLFEALTKEQIETIRIGELEEKTPIPNETFFNPYRFFDRLLYCPDPYIKLEQKAIDAAKSILNKTNYVDFIYAFGAPWSAHRVAIRLKKMYSVPIALDFSIPWVEHPHSKFPTFIHRLVTQKEEFRSIQYSDMIITSNRYIKELLIKKYFGVMSHDRISIIQNGYDPDDHIQTLTNSRQFVLSYLGYVGGDLCNKPFLKAVKMFVDSLSLTPDTFRLAFIGTVKSSYLRYSKSLGLADFISYTINPPYTLANSTCMSSDAFFVSDISHPQGKSIVMFKLQNLIGFKKPVLGLLDDDYLKSIISKTGGFTAQRYNATDIFNSLTKLYINWKNNSTPPFNEELLASHSYTFIATELSRLISRLLLLNF